MNDLTWEFVVTPMMDLSGARAFQRDKSGVHLGIEKNLKITIVRDLNVGCGAHGADGNGIS